MSPIQSLRQLAAGVVDAQGERLAALTDRMTDVMDDTTSGAASAALAAADKVLAGVLGLLGTSTAGLTSDRAEGS